MCLTFFPLLFFDAKNREIFYTIMDKETLIKLAQPAATALLALSIISIPLIAKAEFFSGATVWVKHMNSCAD